LNYIVTMALGPANIKPLVGKTYSLYGVDTSTDGYYERVRAVADLCLRRFAGPLELLSVVRDLSRKKRRLRKLAAAPCDHDSEASLVHTLRANFSPLTANVASHLQGLSIRQKWDRTLTTSEEQYHLHMLEIELVDRLNVQMFRGCEVKLAFLPHCLRDLSADCRSATRGADYVCKGCSKCCNINAVSKLLRRHGVMPYIWMTANLQLLFTRLRREGRSGGVLGIACIPELIRGMRMCSRAGVPVVGIPLDANRCGRWWGEFYPNTVNLKQLEDLLGEETLRRPRQPSARFPHGAGAPQPLTA
jgi:hypothetical protein